MIDPGNHEVGSTWQNTLVEEPHIHGVCGRSINREDSRLYLMNPHRPMQGDRLADGTLLRRGRNRDYVCNIAKSGPQSDAARRKKTIIIGD